MEDGHLAGVAETGADREGLVLRSAGSLKREGFVMPKRIGLVVTCTDPGSSGRARVAWWPRGIRPVKPASGALLQRVTSHE